MEPTRELASFCAGIRLEAIPEDVVRKAKLCILDFVANVYGSLGLEAVSRAAAYVRSLGGPAISTAICRGFMAGPYQAAFLNGISAEAVEAQDGLRFGGNHPGAAVIPAALAIAEEQEQGGKSFLEAVVAGYETANRIAAAIHPAHTLSGFLPTGTCGTFGAACTAGRLMDLAEEGIATAMGNAGYLLPCSMAEALMGGFTVKIVQGGQAGCCGIMAAGLARAGITGPPYVLEGSELRAGFLQIMAGSQPAMEKITEGLGQRFTLRDVYLKPYAACRHTHGAIQAVLELIEEHDVLPEEVDRVRIHTYGIALLAVGKRITAKDSFVSAQFSLPYLVAASLFDRELGPAQIKEDRISDPAALELSRRVEVLVDQELDRAYPEKTPARVEIALTNGTRLERQVDIPKGDPRDPMTLEEVIAKLKRFAAGRNKTGLSEAIQQTMDLEHVPDIREWTALW